MSCLMIEAATATGGMSAIRHLLLVVCPLLLDCMWWLGVGGTGSWVAGAGARLGFHVRVKPIFTGAPFRLRSEQ